MDPLKTLKQQIRHNILALRAQLPPDEQQKKSKQLTQIMLNLPEFNTSQHIAAYWAFNNEISPLALLQEAYSRNKTCYLPVMTVPFQPLEFMMYQPGTPLIKNKAGIFEPRWEAKRTIPAPNLDLVLIPLVAFDETGSRLGAGGGYYDRTFAFLKSTARLKKPFLLGLGYELQCVDRVPTNDWDISLNGIVTEKRFIRFI